MITAFGIGALWTQGRRYSDAIRQFLGEFSVLPLTTRRATSRTPRPSWFTVR